MQIQAIKTCRVDGQQDLNAFVDRHLPSLNEASVVAITSKVVSLCEGRTVPKGSISKEVLIRKEADSVIEQVHSKPRDIILTLKNNVLIPSAGIDETNGGGDYVLYPKDCFRTAKRLWTFLCERRHLKTLGILITDSHTTPLRRGVTGIALAWWGFEPLCNCIGKTDLYGRTLRVTYVNNVDALAVSAVFMMGESNESTPLVVMQDIPHLLFNDRVHSNQEVCIPLAEDLYGPILKGLL